MSLFITTAKGKILLSLNEADIESLWSILDDVIDNFEGFIIAEGPLESDEQTQLDLAYKLAETFRQYQEIK